MMDQTSQVQNQTAINHTLLRLSLCVDYILISASLHLEALLTLSHSQICHKFCKYLTSELQSRCCILHKISFCSNLKTWLNSSLLHIYLCIGHTFCLLTIQSQHTHGSCFVVCCSGFDATENSLFASSLVVCVRLSACLVCQNAYHVHQVAMVRPWLLLSEYFPISLCCSATHVHLKTLLCRSLCPSHLLLLRSRRTYTICYSLASLCLRLSI